MTRGIASPETYYYTTRLYVDAGPGGGSSGQRSTASTATAWRCAESARAARCRLPRPRSSPSSSRSASPDVPFLCDIHRGVGLSPTYPYLILSVPYRAAGRSRASSDEHAGVRRQRPTCEANHGGLPTKRRADGRDVPTIDGVRRLQRDQRPKEIVVYPFGVHDLPRAHVERRLRHLRARLLPEANR